MTHTIPSKSLGIIGEHSVVKAVELKTWAKAHLAANPAQICKFFSTKMVINCCTLLYINAKLSPSSSCGLT